MNSLHEKSGDDITDKTTYSFQPIASESSPMNKGERQFGEVG
jgi:hypothetical protein